MSPDLFRLPSLELKLPKHLPGFGLKVATHYLQRVANDKVSIRLRGRFSLSGSSEGLLQIVRRRNALPLLLLHFTRPIDNRMFCDCSHPGPQALPRLAVTEFWQVLHEQDKYILADITSIAFLQAVLRAHP